MFSTSRFFKARLRRQNILAFLRRVENGATLREIGAAVCLKSVSTVFGHVEAMLQEGLVYRDPLRGNRIFAARVYDVDSESVVLLVPCGEIL